MDGHSLYNRNLQRVRVYGAALAVGIAGSAILTLTLMPMGWRLLALLPVAGSVPAIIVLLTAHKRLDDGNLKAWLIVAGLVQVAMLLAVMLACWTVGLDSVALTAGVALFAGSVLLWRAITGDR